MRDAGEIERAVAAFAEEPNGGMVVLPDATTSVHSELIIDLAARHRLPAVYASTAHARSGSTISIVERTSAFKC